MSTRFRPLVAVAAYHLGGDRVARWPDGGYGVPAPYIEALRRAGARTAILSPGEAGEPEELLEPFHGLLLVGGGDIDPARYGAQPDTAHNYGVEPDRDVFEIDLVRAADRLHLPTLCICRGMQVLNVAFGGSLHQHLPGREGLIPHGVPVDDTTTMHPVTPVEGTLLSATTKSGDLVCSSHHHQGVDRVGEGLVVAGHSPDGLVEALQRPVPAELRNIGGSELSWVLGVQWHPEETASTDPTQQSLFDALTTLARVRGMGARPDEAVGRSRAYGLADPDPGWPVLFEAEATRIRGVLPPALVSRIDHVGSTSVPGLAAKPIIDIQLSLHAMIPRSSYVDPLIGLGYRWVADPWDDEHEYFSLDDGPDRAFQIHACRSGGLWERRHLAFRDALRADARTAESYERLKRELAERHPKDIFAYTDGKTAFVTEVEDRALPAGAATTIPE